MFYSLPMFVKETTVQVRCRFPIAYDGFSTNFILLSIVYFQRFDVKGTFFRFAITASNCILILKGY